MNSTSFSSAAQSCTVAAALVQTSSIFKAAYLHHASPASLHVDMPEELVIISTLLDSHTANSPIANSPALSQIRRCSECPSLSVAIHKVHNDTGAAQPTRHSDCAEHDRLSTSAAYPLRNPMLEGNFSPKSYRRSSLTQTCSPSFSRGRSSSPSQTDWNLALGLPPKADEPAEMVK